MPVAFFSGDKINAPGGLDVGGAAPRSTEDLLAGERLSQMAGGEERLHKFNFRRREWRCRKFSGQ